MQQDRSPRPARHASPRDGGHGLAPGETRTAICPVCAYDKPSLSVTNKAGRLLVYCFNRCCEQPRLFRAAMAALRAGGLDWASPSKSQLKQQWTDQDARSKLFGPVHAAWRNQAVDVADHAVARRYLESRRCVIPPCGSGLRAVDLVEERLRAHLRQFVRAPLIAPGAQPAAAEAVVRALRRRDLALAELVCVVAAYAITLGGVALFLQASSPSWIVAAGPAGARLTPAGWCCALVSSPLFWFLLLRWLWRHAVWGLLLRDLARLDLRLVATHPDGAGGLAFIGQYPNAFAAFVFALSCVLGAAIAQHLLRGGLTAATYGQLMGTWLVVVMILFGAPLLAFSGPLRRLKEATLLVAGAVATRHERAAERELLGRNMSAGSDVEAAASSDIPDPTKFYATTTKLSTFLISRSGIVPVAAAALLPLVAAGATQLPVRELLKIAKGLILL